MLQTYQKESQVENDPGVQVNGTNFHPYERISFVQLPVPQGDVGLQHLCSIINILMSNI